MNYETFLQQSRALPLFDNNALSTLGVNPTYGKLLLHRWVKTGKLIRLKRGLYTLPQTQTQAHTSFSTTWLANYLYSPSYVSLHSVLSRFDLIPEMVVQITSITRLKTAQFNNPLGVFAYKHIKPELFFGFEEIKDEFGRYVLQATPEKALLDLVYFDTQFKAHETYFTQNLRLQQSEQLKKNKLKKFSKRFNLKKITAATDVLLKLL